MGNSPSKWLIRRVNSQCDAAIRSTILLLMSPPPLPPSGISQLFSIRILIKYGMGHRGEEGGEIIDRIRNCFQCLSIIVAREEHEVKGHHYHIGIKNQNANRKNATSKLRAAFPEFAGAQLHVSFHRSWTSVCQYVLKSDANPGGLEFLREMLRSKEKHILGPACKT